MQTSQRLDDHLTRCTEASRQTQDAIRDLATALKTSVAERQAQFDKINWNILKMLMAIIGAVAFEIAKGKGLL